MHDIFSNLTSDKTKSVIAAIAALALVVAGLAFAANMIRLSTASEPFSAEEPSIGVFVPGSTYEMDPEHIKYGQSAALGAVNLPVDIGDKIPSFTITDASKNVATLHSSRSEDGNQVSYSLSFQGVGDVEIEMTFRDPQDAFIPVEDLIRGYVRDEETGILSDPETGYVYDETKQHLVDGDGNEYDLKTKYKIDPDTGYLIDPASGDPIVPTPYEGETYTRTIHVNKYMLTATPVVQEKIYDGTDTATGTYILNPLAGDEDAIRCSLTNGHFEDAEVGGNKHVEFTAELSGVKSDVYDIPSTTVTSDDGVIVPAHIDWMEVDLPTGAATTNGTPYTDVLDTTPSITILDAPYGADVATAPDSVYLEWYDDPECTQKTDMTKLFRGAQGSSKTFYYKITVPDELSHNFVGEKVVPVTVVMLDGISQGNITFTLPNTLTYGNTYQLSVSGAPEDATVTYSSLNANATVSDTGLLTVTGVGDIDVIACSHVEGSADVEKEATSVSLPKQLQVKAQVDPKTYDATPTATATSVVEGIVEGDGEGDILISLANGRFTGTNPADAGTDKDAIFDVVAEGSKTECYSYSASVAAKGTILPRALSDLTFLVDEKIPVSNGDTYATLPSGTSAEYAGHTWSGAMTWYVDEACTTPVDPAASFTGPKDTAFDIYYKISPSGDTAKNFHGTVTGYTQAVIADGNMIQPDFKIVIKDAPTYGETLALGYKGGADGAKVTFAVTTNNAHILADGRTLRVDDLGTITITATCRADGYATKTDSVTYQVAKRKVAITALARDKRYDGSVSAKCNPAIGHVLLTDDVSFTVTGTFSDASIGSNKTATFIVTASGAKKDYYEYPSVITSQANILPMRGAAIDEPFSDMVVANGAAASWLPEATTLEIPAYKTVTGNVAWYDDAARTHRIGKDHIFAGRRHDMKKLYYEVSFGSDAAGYVEGTYKGTIDVIINTDPKPADINITAPTEVTYGDAVTLSAAGSAGDLGDVSYSVRSGDGVIDGNVLTVTGLTPIILEATSAADGYAGAKGMAIIKINKRHLNVSVSCDDKKYDGKTYATGAVSADGFAFSDGDEIWFATANGRFDSADAGTRTARFDIVTTSPKAGFYEFDKTATATGTIR